MGSIHKQEAYVIYALKKFGALTPDRIARYLFENSICGEFDLRKTLAELKQEHVVKQAVSIDGITYELEKADDSFGEAAQLFSDEEKAKMETAAEQLRERFRIENDYIARYSEQATGIIPVFLSLREGEKILFKVNVIVRDAETAAKIAKKWPDNAQKTYRALWDCIGEGMPFPDFTGIWEDKDDEKA